ncbi:hypothetical protein GOP47_0005808 [Adiantum capillus-veneris]|uniref:Myb-like domain-containing protein n=1 Tax=Adiantum capillus-veneris TaxID=13818 RepID=A0A9D4V693_ADICA|nr:hypothetical protein GOP47_0005808 [Adiantum capillus-veneris]
MTQQPSSAPPGLPSPGQQPQLLLQAQHEHAPHLLPSQEAADSHSLPEHHEEQEQKLQADHVSFTVASVPDDAELSYRATRSSFPFSHKNGEMAIEVAKAADSLIPNISDKHFRGGAWKDDWVVSLIHLRGSMDDEFMKPQKPGIDMWSKVSSQLAEAHEDFDKNSESCRKKWQRVYKAFKDDKALLAASSGEKYLSCKWFDLVEHYMHNHVDQNGGADDQPTSAEEVTHPHSAHAPPTDSVNHLVHQYKLNAKRARKDQKVKESLSQMVETWRESLEVLKDSEAKRLEILQTLSNTMAGLLDVLRQ